MTANAFTQQRRAEDYTCEPVKLVLTQGHRSLQKAHEGLLSQYDAPWPGPPDNYFVAIETGTRPDEVPECAGNYLHSYRLHVDRRGTHLVSFSNAGVWMDFDEPAKRALIRAPRGSDWETVVEEVEQQLVLLLARAWSAQGWTPLHAGTLIPPEKNGCVLVCAHSGVGKTTFVTSLLRRGWRSLGDDKALLQPSPQGVLARA